MKSLKIVTYCTWTSIGSILQSLGLKKALHEIGCESTILLDSHSNNYGHTKIHSLKSLAVRSFEVLNSKKRRAAFNKRMSFISQNIDIKSFSDYDELKSIVEKDDSECIFAGSDQIWNPGMCSQVFFLDFVQNKKRISYAASMGNTVIPEENKVLFRRLINNFDLISVREDECAEIIRQYTDKDVQRNIDPTFLVRSDEWRSYEKEYKNIQKPYILLYMLYWDVSCAEKIKKLKKETGLPVYAITNGLTRAYADKYLYDVGVEEFLWLIDNAEYVVTSSFHGVAFSTIFNKKYAAVVNPSAPSRINNLMETLSVPKIDISDLGKADCFDYDTVNGIIESEREKSIRYLEKAIE